MPGGIPKTKLSLDRWRSLMGIHPLHFWQVRFDEADNSICSDIYFNESWQTADHISRAQLAQTIAEVEDEIEQWLGFHIAPEWEVDEWRPSLRPNSPEFVNYNSHDIRGFRQTVRADWGYFISGGIKAQTLIEAGVTIAYTDEDGDGYKETATVTVNTVAQDINEIAIFYPGKNGDEAWEIQNPQVSIATPVATIVFRREQAVIPGKLEVFNIEGAEAIGDVDADFLETVDVYRRYNDPQAQVSFLWEPLATGLCGTCGGSGCTVCGYATQTGCLILRGEPRQSLVGYWPATWNEDTLEFDRETWAVNRNPDIVRLYYYSGWRDKNSQYVSRLSPDWERTVAYMAAARLPRPPCDCSADTWRMWREDLNLASGDENGPMRYNPLLSRVGLANPLDNPLGSRRGELQAWRKISGLGLIRAQAVVL